MTPDFFIHLTLATHRVADILPKEDPLGSQLKASANKLLTSVLLLVETNPVTREQKLAVAPWAIREAGVLVAYLNYAKRVSKANPENFKVLEGEYAKVGDFVRRFHEELAGETGSLRQTERMPREPHPAVPEAPRPSSAQQPKKEGLSPRQERILALMRGKDRVQVWELQKVFPEVTKRTLRRDMDDLLQRSLIVRQGEWNQVFYQIRPSSGE